MRVFSICTFVFLITVVSSKAQLTTKFESSGGTETPTYEEGISFYQQLAESSDLIQMQGMGSTDSGHPLHLVTYSSEGPVDWENLDRLNKIVLLINNAIHPGEPDGVDASMMLLRDLAADATATERLKDIVIAVIPFYNIGGVLNRNSGTRANQNGPKEYGFRGNARNYDLNRDFVKMDTRNAWSFAEIFHRVKPDVFVDNHVSNGADYQYTLTLISTQHNKLGGTLGGYMNETMTPKLMQGMAEKNMPITPFVNVYNKAPDESGFMQFMDLPRYSTGYTTLFHVLGFMVETHMLKPFDQRVKATYEFLNTMIDVSLAEKAQIKSMRQKALRDWPGLVDYTTEWRIDRKSPATIKFLGYEATKRESSVTGRQRLYYDRSKPFEKNVPYFNNYVSRKFIQIPSHYVIPQGWHNIIKRLEHNGVEMTRIGSDSTIAVERYRLRKFNTGKSPFEGHYMHTGLEVDKEIVSHTFRAGDYLVATNQASGRYAVEVLEPQSPDSFFSWNFFDTILQQKEHFSPYVFEDLAAQLLEENVGLRQDFEAKKEADVGFANNSFVQLNYIYTHSDHYEKAHMIYPVFRITK